MKMVKVLGLSLGVAIAGILAGCGEAGAPPSTTYTSIQQCVDDGNSRDVCIHSMGIAMAQARTAPHYATAQDCAALYGPSGCQVQRGSDGSSWFTPMLEGFVIAQMLDNSGGYCHRYNGAYCYNGYYSQPVYFNRTGGYSTVVYVNNRPTFSSAPVTYTSRVSTTTYSSGGSSSSYTSTSRATTTSRGGFGGSSSGGGFGGGG
jgi:uncharacterized protein YgiB involved in biofilm formation